MRVAVIGLFHREFFYIPLWQNYYGKLFGLENLYAIGDLQKDETFKLFNKGVNFINYAPPLYANHSEHTQLIIQVQKQLLENYDVVIFAEADQFFIPDPDKYLNLNDYLHHNTQDYIKVSGWNVRQDLNTENFYNPTLKILEQRNYWFKDPGPEDKMVIVRKPAVSYGHGFHQSVPSIEPDKDLYNIHMHLFDFDQCNCRRYIRTADFKNWHPGSGPNRSGNHVFIKDKNLINTWFDYPLNTTGIQMIPEKFKKMLYLAIRSMLAIKKIKDDHLPA
jgi:hypothetical protein